MEMPSRTLQMIPPNSIASLTTHTRRMRTVKCGRLDISQYSPSSLLHSFFLIKMKFLKVLHVLFSFRNEDESGERIFSAWLSRHGLSGEKYRSFFFFVLDTRLVRVKVAFVKMVKFNVSLEESVPISTVTAQSWQKINAARSVSAVSKKKSRTQLCHLSYFFFNW